MPRMTTEPEDAQSGPAYAYRPSMFGAPREFRLSADALEWTAGARKGRIPFAKIRCVRMAYRPMSMQTYRFVTEVWADGAPKLIIASTSWKSFVEYDRLDAPYRAFVGELHRRLAEAGAPARFERGRPALVYWPGLALLAAVTCGLVFLIVRALQSDAKAGALFIAAFLAMLLWQGRNFFGRNRPGVYRAADPPKALLPG